jgi:catechol 2,3-dioxygenase-like lactoylglutathione lyase family enzyme
MTVSLVGLTLHVADVDRSLEFYCRLPGAAVLFHLPGRFALLRLGQGRLGLLADRDRPFHVELEVADLDAATAELRGLGMDLDGPTDRRWGERDVLARDPDGNLLEFSAPRTPEPPGAKP